MRAHSWRPRRTTGSRPRMAQAGRVWTSGAVGHASMPTRSRRPPSGWRPWVSPGTAPGSPATAPAAPTIAASISRLLACARRLHPREEMRPAAVEDDCPRLDVATPLVRRAQPARARGGGPRDRGQDLRRDRRVDLHLAPHRRAPHRPHPSSPRRDDPVGPHHQAAARDRRRRRGRSRYRRVGYARMNERPHERAAERHPPTPPSPLFGDTPDARPHDTIYRRIEDPYREEPSMSLTLATVADALIEFILSLLRDPEVRAEFEQDPDAALAQRGLQPRQPVATCRRSRPSSSNGLTWCRCPCYVRHAQQEQHHTSPVVREIQQVSNHFAWVDDRDTIVDQSVNQNIWADGDVTQTFDNHAVVASGDDAIAAGDGLEVDKTTDQSTDDRRGRRRQHRQRHRRHAGRGFLRRPDRRLHDDRRFDDRSRSMDPPTTGPPTCRRPIRETSTRMPRPRPALPSM